MKARNKRERIGGVTFNSFVHKAIESERW